MTPDLFQQPPGFPSLAALLDYAAARGWSTYQIGDYPPQLAVMTWEGAGSRGGNLAGRIWLHISLLPSFHLVLMRLLPGLALARSRPAIPPEDAHGLTFVQILGGQGISRFNFCDALISEICIPKLDGSSKDDPGTVIIEFSPRTVFHKWPPSQPFHLSFHL